MDKEANIVQGVYVYKPETHGQNMFLDSWTVLKSFGKGYNDYYRTKNYDEILHRASVALNLCRNIPTENLEQMLKDGEDLMALHMKAETLRQRVDICKRWKEHPEDFVGDTDWIFEGI